MPVRKLSPMPLLERFSRHDGAATSIEYALIGVIMAIGLLAVIVPLRSELAAMFTSIADAMANALAG